MLTIPFREIHSISKQNTIGFVPNAIEIRTQKDSAYFFGSLMFRDQTFAILSELHKLHQRKAKAMARAVTNNVSLPDDPYVSDAYEKDDEGEDEEEEEDEDNSSERDSYSDSDHRSRKHAEECVEERTSDPLNDGISSGQSQMRITPNISPNANAPLAASSSPPTQLPNPPATIASSYKEKAVMSAAPPTKSVPAAEQEQKSKDTSGNKAQENTNNNTSQDGNQQQQSISPNNNGNSANGTGDDGDDDKKKKKPHDEDKHDPIPKKHKKVKKRESKGSQEESTNANEANIEEPLSDSAVDSTQVPPIENVFWSPDKNYKPKEIFNVTIPLPLTSIYNILFTESGELEKMYHTARGDSDLVISQFQRTKETIGKIREVKFLNIIKNKPVSFGPNKTRVITTQRVVLFKGKKKCLNQFSMVSLDVPYGDCFKIQTDIEFSERNDQQGCDVKCNLGIIFVKSVNFLFRGTIEDFALSETTLSLKLWIEQAKLLVSKHIAKTTSKPEKRTLKDSRRKHKVNVTENLIVPEPTTSSTTSMGEIVPTKTDFNTSSVTEIQDIDAGGSLLMSLLKIPGKFCNDVQIPLWIALLLAILILLFVLPQQYKLNSALGRIEGKLLLFKQQQTQFEQEIHALMLGITTNVTSPDKLKSKLDEWMKNKASKDPERFAIQTLLTTTLKQLDEIRKRSFNPADLTSTAHDNQQNSVLLWQLLQTQQRQQLQEKTITSFTGLQYWIITLSIVAFVAHKIFFRAS